LNRPADDIEDLPFRNDSVIGTDGIRLNHINFDNISKFLHILSKHESEKTVQQKTLLFIRLELKSFQDRSYIVKKISQDLAGNGVGIGVFYSGRRLSQ